MTNLEKENKKQSNNLKEKLGNFRPTKTTIRKYNIHISDTTNKILSIQYLILYIFTDTYFQRFI